VKVAVRLDEFTEKSASSIAQTATLKI